MSKLAAVSLDVDGVRHYHAIHGLPGAADVACDPPVERGVRRFLDLCETLDIKATLFVVSQDLDPSPSGDELRALLARAARDGHEIASHSHTHAYDLSRKAPAAIEADLLRSVDALTAVTGKRPMGFRAPGYNLTEELLDAVEKAGFSYDSSVMPSPWYWGARALAIGAHRFMGTPSSSLVGRARAFATPRAPYRPRQGCLHKSARARIEGRALIEVPIATMGLGVPWLGTTLALQPLPLAAIATALALSSSAPCVLELHAIDLCDADDGFHPALVRLQRELIVQQKTKMLRLQSTLRMMSQARDMVTVEEIATRTSLS